MALMRIPPGRLLHLRTTLIAVDGPQPRHQKSQVIVDFGRGGDGTATSLVTWSLIDTDRRRQSIDQIDIGTLQLVQILPSVNRQAFDVLSLAFRVERIECQRALTGPAASAFLKSLPSERVCQSLLRLLV